MRRILSFVIIATLAAGLAAGLYFGGVFDDTTPAHASTNNISGPHDKYYHVVTKDGLMITMIMGSEVKDGENTPFFMRVQRVSGNSDQYIVGGMAFAFEKTANSCRNYPVCWAAYTVDNGDVLYGHGVKVAMKTTETTDKKSSDGLHVTNFTHASATRRANIQFVDNGQHVIRVGQLRVGDWVSFKGVVTVENRSYWHMAEKNFFRLRVGFSQLVPSWAPDQGPAMSLWSSSLYIAS